MFPLFLLMVMAIPLIQSCTYTPVEWLDHRNLIQQDNQTNRTICRIEWFQILEINVAHMKIPQNQLWVVVAQQYIAARLNKLRTSVSTLDGDNISECLLFLGNSLEYYCNNISQWKLGEKEESSLTVLDNFNHGTLEKFPRCDSVHILPASESETYFYYQSIDTFIVRDYHQNETISRSEYLGLINTNAILTLSFGFLVLWLLVCFLKMAIDANAKKRYKCWKNATKSIKSLPSPSLRGDVNIELSSDDEPIEI